MAARLACADFAFPLLAHDQALDLVATLGFKAVDLGLFEGRSHQWPSRVLKAPAKSAGELGRKLAGRGLKPSDVFLQAAPDFASMAPNHPELTVRRQARDVFLRTLEFAHACGCRHVTGLPGVYFDGEDKDDGLSRCRDELAWRCEQAKKARIVYAIEPHVGSLVAVPWDADHLVQSVPGLTLTLDYAHFIREGFPGSTVDPLLRLASHVHARAATKDKLQARFEENIIDFGRIIGTLTRSGYQGFVCVEYVWTTWEHCNEVDNLSETIQMREHLQSLLKPAPAKRAPAARSKAKRGKSKGTKK